MADPQWDDDMRGGGLSDIEETAVIELLREEEMVESCRWKW